MKIKKLKMKIKNEKVKLTKDELLALQHTKNLKNS